MKKVRNTFKQESIKDYINMRKFLKYKFYQLYLHKKV